MTLYIKFFKKIFPSFIYIFFKKIYHILRFYNIINPEYSTSDSIKFGDEETGKFLREKIIRSKIFLEYGSGNTSILAFKNNVNIYSIESDRNFYFFLKKKKLKKFIFL